MNVHARQRRLRRIYFYTGAIALVVAVVTYQHYVQSKTQVYGVVIERLSPLQDKQLQAFLGMNQLLIALGTTLLGAMGFILANRLKTRAPLKEAWPAVASAAFVGLSLYYGYKGYDDIVFMLQPGTPTFDLYGPLIRSDRTAHFTTLMIGVFLFADFALHEFNQEGGT